MGSAGCMILYEVPGIFEKFARVPLCRTLTSSSKRPVIPFIIHSFIHSFIHSLVRSFAHSLIHSFAHSLVRSFAHSLACSFAHPLIRSFPRALIQSFTRPLTHSCTSASLHPCTNSFTHELIHQLTDMSFHQSRIDLCTSRCKRGCMVIGSGHHVHPASDSSACECFEMFSNIPLTGGSNSRYQFASDNGGSKSGSPTFDCLTLNDHNKLQNGCQFQNH